MDDKNRHLSEKEILEISNSGRESYVGDKKVDIQTPQGFKFGLIKKAHDELVVHSKL